MNKKGFTLVELLAVMVILLSISVVTVTNVTASLKRNDNQTKETQKQTAINAAKIYFSAKNELKVGASVSINSLISDNYVERDDVSSYVNYYVKLCSSGYSVSTSWAC